MISKLSWCLLVGAGTVGSGAGIALTQPEWAETPSDRVINADANTLPDAHDLHRSSGADEFIKAQVRAQAASREPFAVFRAATPRH